MENQPTPAVFLRSDGYAETSDGLFVVIMLAMSGHDENLSWLQFRTSYTSPTVRIEWNAGEKIAVLPSEITNSLINKGYARNPTAQEMVKITEYLTPVPPTEPTKAAEPTKKPAVKKSVAMPKKTSE